MIDALTVFCNAGIVAECGLSLVVIRTGLVRRERVAFMSTRRLSLRRP